MRIGVACDTVHRSFASCIASSIASCIAFCLVLCLASCRIDEIDGASWIQRIVNTCEDDPDCNGGTLHGACGGGMCVAPSGQIDTAFLEVVPAASALYGAGHSFLVALNGLSHSSRAKEIVLPNYADIEGIVTTSESVLGGTLSENCEHAFDSLSRSLQVHVEFSRHKEPYGLPGFSVAANSERTSNTTSWVFKTSVPPGTYDIYATTMAGCDLDFPPLYVPNQVFEPGTVAFKLPVAALSVLSGTITPPAVSNDHASLAGWTISLVEPSYGKVISTTQKLGDGVTNFKIRTLPLKDSSPLVQIAPPENVVAPTLTWDLAVLDLDADGVVDLDLSSLDLSVVHVNANIVTLDFEPVADASVRLQSTSLHGATLGLNARYESATTADANGMISVLLLPGTYQVEVTPLYRTDLAITRAAWTVGRTPAEQAGRTVEVTPTFDIIGSIHDPIASRPFEGIEVHASPSTQRFVSYYERILEPQFWAPRHTSTIVGEGGEFVIDVDPGVMDLTARPSETSKFPWLVTAFVNSPCEPLGPMHITFPVPLTGTLRDPRDNPVQQAKLTVYAIASPNTDPRFPDKPRSPRAVAVAEGRTDELGTFSLLLPSELTPF